MGKIKRSVVRAGFEKLVNETPMRRARATIERAGGYDPAKGPKHPDNQDPTLEHGRLVVNGADLGPAVRHPDGRIEAGPHVNNRPVATEGPRADTPTLTTHEGKTLTHVQIDMLRRYALAAVFTSPTTPSKFSSGDKARATDDLISMGLLAALGRGPTRPTAAGFEILLERIKTDVGAAFAALRKAQTKVSKCSKPQSLDAALGEQIAAEARYREVAAERDVLVQARNKVCGRG